MVYHSSSFAGGGSFLEEKLLLSVLGPSSSSSASVSAMASSLASSVVSASPYFCQLHGYIRILTPVFGLIHLFLFSGILSRLLGLFIFMLPIPCINGNLGCFGQASLEYRILRVRFCRLIIGLWLHSWSRDEKNSKFFSDQFPIFYKNKILKSGRLDKNYYRTAIDDRA